MFPPRYVTVKHSDAEVYYGEIFQWWVNSLLVVLCKLSLCCVVLSRVLSGLLYELVCTEGAGENNTYPDTYLVLCLKGRVGLSKWWDTVKTKCFQPLWEVTAFIAFGNNSWTMPDHSLAKPEPNHGREQPRLREIDVWQLPGTAGWLTHHSPRTRGISPVYLELRGVNQSQPDGQSDSLTGQEPAGEGRDLPWANPILPSPLQEDQLLPQDRQNKSLSALDVH